MSHYDVINKDVTTVENGVIAQGVNCRGKMNSGVAKFLRAKYPDVFEPYQRVAMAYGYRAQLLGKCLIVNVTPDYSVQIANCFTQEFYGKDGKKYANVDAVRDSLKQAFYFASAADKPLYMPRIGCGLGGLDWDSEVGPIVSTLAEQYNVQTFVCDFTP